MAKSSVHQPATDEAASPLASHLALYQRLGFHLLPLKPRSKAPATQRGFWDASSDPAQIAEWFGSGEFNIGILTGDQSRIVVIDVDPRNGGDVTLKALEEKHGSLPPIWRFRTGGGGEHILFAYPFPDTEEERERLENSRWRKALGQGLDVKADRGYIVAPPSIHPDGGTYEIAAGHHPDDMPLPEMPEWLLTLALAPIGVGDGWTPSDIDAMDLTDEERAAGAEWTEARLEDICAEVRELERGDISNGLTRLAAKAGGLVHLLPDGIGQARAALEEAAGELGLLPRDKAFGPRGTIARQLQFGADQPRMPFEVERMIDERLMAALGEAAANDDGSDWLGHQSNVAPIHAPPMRRIRGRDPQEVEQSAAPEPAGEEEEPQTKAPEEAPGEGQPEAKEAEAEPAGIFRPREAPPSVAATQSSPAARKSTAPLSATPFVWVDPASIPCRRWIYDRHYVRRYVSATVAQPGVGKSSLGIVEALAIVTGRDLLGVKPLEQTNVWIFNLEDPLDELQRRVAAALIQYGIDPAEVEGKLFLDSGRTQRLKITKKFKKEMIVDPVATDQIEATIREKEIGVFIIDPFVSVHDMQENDNGAIDQVVKAFADIADHCNCAVDLVHHTRKGVAGEAKSVEDARGGSALLGAVRSARVLNPMSKDEALKYSIDPAERFAYFAIEDGKANMAIRSGKASWRRLESVSLGNGKVEKDDRGQTRWEAPADTVGVVTAWKPPNAAEALTGEQLDKLKDELGKEDWLADPNARSRWVGVLLASIMGLNLQNDAEKATVKSTLTDLNHRKVLGTELRQDAKQSKKRNFVVWIGGDDQSF